MSKERGSDGKIAPSWVHLSVAVAMGSFSVVGWSYQTFVTIRERDMVKGMFETRLEKIEHKEDQLNDKLDVLILRLNDKGN